MKLTRLRPAASALACAGPALADNDLTGIDADTDLQGDGKVTLELVVQRAQRGAHVGRGADGAKRVVFPDPWYPEQHDDSIADELLDRPPMALSSRSHSFEVTASDITQRFGIKGLAEHG